MKKADGIVVYDSLEEQYRNARLPTDLIHPDGDFTVFDLADLKQAMPFSLPVGRLNFLFSELLSRRPALT